MLSVIDKFVLLIYPYPSGMFRLEITFTAELSKKRELFFKKLGAVSIRKTVLPGMAIPMLKIRRPNGRLIFKMEIAIRR